MTAPDIEDVEGCEFCDVIAGRASGPPIAYEDGHFLVFVGRYQPTGEGYALVVPRAHVRDLHQLPDDECGRTLAMVRRVSRAMQSAFSVTGTTIVQNTGPPGQSVMHLHFHIVTRRTGDDYVRKAARAESEQELHRQAAVLRASLSQ